MNFPNNSLAGVIKQNVLIFAPAVGVCGIKITDHGTVAICADSSCVGVLCFGNRTVAVNYICIIHIFIVAVECQRPNAAGLVVGHGGCALDRCAGLRVGTGSVELYAYAGSLGSPYLKGSSGRSVGTAQTRFVIRLSGVVFEIALVVVAALGDIGFISRRRYAHSGDQEQSN